MELVVSVLMFAFLAGAALTYHRLSQNPTPSEDGGRGFRDLSLSEAKALQNRNDGIDIH